MYPYTRELLAQPIPYFRTEAFSAVVLECAARLKRLAGAPENAHVYLLTCSGTGAMEAAVAGCFAKDDHALVIDGGGFGHRFAEICAHHGIGHARLPIPFGEDLTRARLDAHNNNIDAVLVNHHETSVGRLYDLDTIAAYCRENGAYLVVDAISSFLADPIDFERQGIDALILSSQKALALPPGLSVLLLSDRLYRRMAEKDVRPFSLYFDLRDAEANAVRGQTPYTPAVGTILALRERLAHLEAEGGQAAAVAATRALAEGFRALLKDIPVALPAHPLSCACTPLLFPQGGAKRTYKKLSEEHDIWLNPNGGEEADRLLRVGHLGDLTPDDGKLLAGLLADILSA
jgi:aspartate aminotransferase-like enzyme